MSSSRTCCSCSWISGSRSKLTTGSTNDRPCPSSTAREHCENIMNLKISHTTRYRFEAPVTFGLQQLRMTPKSRQHQRVLSWDTRVEGGHKQLEYVDHHLNTVELIGLDRGCTELVVTSGGSVELTESNGISGRHVGPAPLWLYQRVTPRTKAGQGVKALVRALPTGSDLERCHALMAAVAEAVPYLIGASEAGWNAEEALAEGRGVCQDHSHIFLACAREMGLPARYVSGYL